MVSDARANNGCDHGAAGVERPTGDQTSSPPSNNAGGRKMLAPATTPADVGEAWANDASSSAKNGASNALHDAKVCHEFSSKAASSSLPGSATADPSPPGDAEPPSSTLPGMEAVASNGGVEEVAGLDATDFESLLDHLATKEYAPGEFVFRRVCTAYCFCDSFFRGSPARLPLPLPR